MLSLKGIVIRDCRLPHDGGRALILARTLSIGVLQSEGIERPLDLLVRGDVEGVDISDGVDAHPGFGRALLDNRGDGCWQGSNVAAKASGRDERSLMAGWSCRGHGPHTLNLLPVDHRCPFPRRRASPPARGRRACP
jgi:hypothetical protein